MPSLVKVERVGGTLSTTAFKVNVDKLTLLPNYNRQVRGKETEIGQGFREKIPGK